jgi:hypothetical protein
MTDTDTTAAVAAAREEAANHRQLKADLIDNTTGNVIHANTCVVCLMDWPCSTVVLADENQRLRERLAGIFDTRHNVTGFGGLADTTHPATAGRGEELP